LVTVADVLPKPIDDESFDFYGRTLNGQKSSGALEAGGGAVNASLGEAVGADLRRTLFRARRRAHR